MRIFVGAVADDASARLAGVSGRLETPLEGLRLEKPAHDLAVLEAVGTCDLAIGRDGLVAVVAARLDDRKSLGERLGLERDASDAELVLFGFRRWGDAVARELSGDFAFAVWDPGERRLFCAVDPLGIGALFTAELPNGGVAFASHPTPLRHLMGDSLRLDRETLARYLCRLPVEPSRTSFVGIDRVAPGTTVAFQTRDRSPSRTVRRYWDVHDLPRLQLRSPEEYLEAYRSALTRAVSRRLEGNGTVAIAQSGGLDSASILGLGVEAGAGPRLRPVYVAPVEASCDESDLVARLERHVGVPIIKRRPAGDLETLRRVGRATGEPRYLDQFPVAWSALEGARDTGATRVLTGLYGDLVSGSIPTPAWLPSLLRANLLRTWWAEVRRPSPRGMTRAILGSLRSLPTSQPLLRRRGESLRRPWLGGASCLSTEARGELGIDVAEAEFLTEVARGYQDASFHRSFWVRAVAPDETEYLGRAAAFLGLEAAHPFADGELLRVSLSLPLELLRKGDLGRYPLRAALAGVVPDSLRTQQRKVVFTDFYRGLFERLVPELSQLPLAEPLRPLLSSHRLEALVQKGTWSYPEGAHLWRCLAVNAWLWEHLCGGFPDPGAVM